MHGDWFNGWNPTINEQWNNNCTRALWDCAQNGLTRDKVKLLFHDRNFQNTSPANYLIPVRELSALCPGDTDQNTIDISYCSSALAANPSAVATHNQQHGHGGDTGTVAGDSSSEQPDVELDINQIDEGIHSHGLQDTHSHN